MRICDRCGKESSGKPWDNESVREVAIEVGGTVRKKDLCGECQPIVMAAVFDLIDKIVAPSCRRGRKR